MGRTKTTTKRIGNSTYELYSVRSKVSAILPCGDSPYASGKKTFLIKIDSIPKNADVFLNGITACKAPCVLPVEIMYGISAAIFQIGIWHLSKIPKRTIEVIKDGYLPVFESLDFSVTPTLGIIRLHKNRYNFVLKQNNFYVQTLTLDLQPNDNMVLYDFKTWLKFVNIQKDGLFWIVKLRLSETKTIKSMTIRINTDKRIWEADTNAATLPWQSLFVVYDNRLINNLEYSFNTAQLINNRSEVLGTFPPGEYIFSLFTQSPQPFEPSEPIKVQNSELNLVFHDGISITAVIGERKQK